MQSPDKILLKNNSSAYNNVKFVNAEIEKLQNLKIISEVPVPPIVVNPLTVSYNSSYKPRLVLDLINNLSLYI